MNKLLLLALSATMFGIASAHLSMICSSTEASKPGQIDFWFGTYHQFQTKTPPGTVTISQPSVSGNKPLSGSFSQKYDARVNNQFFMIKDTAATKANLVAKAGLSNSALVSCYVQNAASEGRTAPPDGQWIIPASGSSDTQKKDLLCQTSSSYPKVGFWSKLTIKDAKSGDWKLVVKGTDQVYDPGQKQCSLSTKNPKWIGGMTVADGSPACTGTPTVGANFDDASVKSCPTTSGATCSFKCASDKDKKSGVIECRKGKWHVTAKCVPASKCAQEAQAHIAAIGTSVNSCQSVVNGLTNGAHCPKEGQSVVDAAKSSAKTADTNAKNAAASLATAQKTPVQFSAIPLDKIDSSSCAKLFEQLKANSNYNAAKQALDSATTANTNAAAAKTAADKAVTDALDAQTKAIMKCKCSASKAMNDAYGKCTQNAAAEKKQWKTAHHLECVQAGTVSLNDKDASQGTCKVPPVPTVTKKKMAYPVTEAECKKAGVEAYMAAEDAMDTAFEASVEEIDFEQTGVSMPGWHHMDDGSMMKDSDM